ncbi:ribosome recycling factor [Kordiimonas marina]|uniref:ribosome recycling factor n=1 Tax=Kordiimonas marina TaxID=2872312 RepID=UPI001FF4D5B1|nr:ribosome recycling factor [Kordiimonas marina]MCJ9428752.1 ribosome recycling factor [Kordiimonas marina]
MSDEELDLGDIERRMKGAVEALKHEFAGLRSGRASASLLEPVVVDVYGASMPLNQVGTISVPEPRMLSVSVWDKSNASAVEKAIRNAGLGLNPMLDGTLVRIPIPELNAERRAELAKVAGKYAEQARIAVRNVRRDGMDQLKRMEKDKAISEDDHKMYADEVQSLTDQYIGQIDSALQTKEAEITQV